MNLRTIFEKINFKIRYEKLCENYGDFDNRLRGNNKLITSEVIKDFHIPFKYISNGSFYQITGFVKDFEVTIHLVLKNGIVETLLFITKGNTVIEPQGRLDFFPEKLGIPFNRSLCNLLYYSSKNELTEILKEILAIYEDIKSELIIDKHGKEVS